MDIQHPVILEKGESFFKVSINVMNHTVSDKTYYFHLQIEMFTILMHIEFSNDFRLLGKSPYLHFNLEQLVEQLVEAETLEEQTDILHYLVLCYGLKQKILLPDVSSKITNFQFLTYFRWHIYIFF